MRMYKIFKFILILTLFSLPAFADKDISVAKQLLARVAPQYEDKISFVQTANAKSDYFELETIQDKLIIKGNNANSMAVGLNYFLKYYCLTTVTWYADDVIKLPKSLPILTKKVSVQARTKNRFFLNYCTFGYTMVWWKWKDWERFIDWMALNGVNMPLAITGQEAIWYKVWRKMGLSDSEIRNYFTGPAHLPWHRMSNLDYWQGDLPHSWLENQVKLQKQILERERELSMKPVLPAFSGHVPKELKRIYPQAKISLLSSWGGFPDKYRSSFLDPTDPLFQTIQKEFLNNEIKLFGTDNIYGADPFNEVDPPSFEPQFLEDVSKTIYNSISSVDKKAIWLQMTWIFYFERTKWTNPRIQAYLKAVPQDKMLLLDYYCENTEVWKITDKYFGQPYLWCYLGNFGGNTMLAGNIKEVGKRIENAYKSGGDNFWGLGSTLEGFDVNPFMYEYVLEKAWNSNFTDEEWIQKLADRYIGRIDENYRKAWMGMYDKIYIEPAHLGQGTLTNARPSLFDNGNWTTNPSISYDNKDLCKIWGAMVQCKGPTKSMYWYEIVNIGRQVLGNYFLELRNNFSSAYQKKDLVEMKRISDQMLVLLNDLNDLTLLNNSFSLNKWIDDSRSFGLTDIEKAYYEKNARTLITTWGGKNQSLNDYGNRTWSGLISTYYAPRWKMFLDNVIKSCEQNVEYDNQSFIDSVTTFEVDWTKSHDVLSIHTSKSDDMIKMSELYIKYKNLILE